MGGPVFRALPIAENLEIQSAVHQQVLKHAKRNVPRDLTSELVTRRFVFA